MVIRGCLVRIVSPTLRDCVRAWKMRRLLHKRKAAERHRGIGLATGPCGTYSYGFYPVLSSQCMADDGVCSWLMWYGEQSGSGASQSTTPLWGILASIRHPSPGQDWAWRQPSLTVVVCSTDVDRYVAVLWANENRRAKAQPPAWLDWKLGDSYESFC